jgi:hypothetical protein
MDLVIFDCDGVLVDSEIHSNALLAEMMTELGHPMTTREALEKFAGRSLTDVLALAEGVLGRKVPEELGQAYGRRLLDRLHRELKPVADVKAAVAALPHRRCVASSSSFERIRLSLDVTGLAPLFDGHIFSATQVARGNPPGPASVRGANDGCRSRPLRRRRRFAVRRDSGHRRRDDGHWVHRRRACDDRSCPTARGRRRTVRSFFDARVAGDDRGPRPPMTGCDIR